MIFEKLLREVDGGDVLDVGCGTGQFTEVLARSLGSFNTILGVDVDQSSIDQAKEKLRDGKYRFMMVDPHVLPFGNNTFDMVVISKALHHVEDPGHRLGDMKRVLKKGGFFFINEMHRDRLSDSQESHMLYHHLRSEIDSILGISHNHTFYREDLIRFSEVLELRERVILEFSPDAERARHPENIAEFIEKMESWLTALDGYPEKQEILGRMEVLKQRFHDRGISRPPQMLILGKK